VERIIDDSGRIVRRCRSPAGIICEDEIGFCESEVADPRDLVGKADRVGI